MRASSFTGHRQSKRRTFHNEQRIQDLPRTTSSLLHGMCVSVSLSKTQGVTTTPPLERIPSSLRSTSTVALGMPTQAELVIITVIY